LTSNSSSLVVDLRQGTPQTRTERTPADSPFESTCRIRQGFIELRGTSTELDFS